MPELTKTPRTNASQVQIIIQDEGAKFFIVPREKAKGVAQLLQEYEQSQPSSIPANDVFASLDKKYGKAGAILQGARLKEEMSQLNLAKKLGISQGDLSKMEHGKRSIGPKMAKRLSKVLKIDYRVFL